MTRSTIVVTGASSGLGKAIAERLAQSGTRVIGTSRTAPANGSLLTPGVAMARLDVCDDASVEAFVARLAAESVVPRTIILNAGYGIAGAIEETAPDAALAQFNTNLIGAHRVVRAFLPTLRASGGQLIFIGSVAGRIALPFQAFYSASKAALASYVEALRIELRPFDIWVTLIEPGDHRTDFPARRQPQGNRPDSPYEPLRTEVLNAMVASETAGAPPESLARVVARIVATDRPKRRHLKINATERFFVVQKAMLPGSWFDHVLRKVYKIP
jgi:short-subunit dehydrogenase